MTLVLLADSIRSGSLGWLSTLGWASLEGGILALLVWAVSRAVPSLPAAVRVWLWWLVSLKLLLGIVPVPGVALPWLPALRTETAVAQTAPRTPDAAPVSFVVPAPVATESATRAIPPMSPQAPVSLPYASFWPALLVLAWLGLVLLQVRALTHAMRDARRLRREAVQAPAGIVHRTAQLVALFALPVMPRVLASRLSAVPLITGVFRPAIVLPKASTDTLSRAELDLVLGHELAHVRRGDLLWGWVPAIAGRIFFFHPLAHLAVREYLAAREEACDAEVLQTLDAAPAEYGQLLMKLGVATTDDVLAAASSSPTFELLKRRLIMLDRSRTPASRWWWTLAGAMTVLVPLTLAAQPSPPPPPAPPPAPSARIAPRANGPVELPPLPPAPPAAPVAPEAPLPPAPPLDEIEIDEAPPAPPAPPVPPVPPPAAPAWAAPPAPPTPPAPPAPPRYVQDGRRRSRQVETPWVLLEPGNRDVMSGNSEDRAEAERHRKSPDDTLLWFRHQGTPYVTRDPATIKAVRDAFGPVNALGEDMKRIGEKMGAQGRKQGEIGARQGEIGAQQAVVATQLARVSAEQAARQAELARKQLVAESHDVDSEAARQRARERRAEERALRESLRTEQRAIEEKVQAEMRALEEKQRALGAEMDSYGKVMAEHSAEMQAVSKKMEATIERAQADVQAVFGNAVMSGKATPAK